MQKGMGRFSGGAGGAQRARREDDYRSLVPDKWSLLARSGQPILLAAADGKLLFANAAAHRALGYEPPLLEGLNWLAWIHGADEDGLRETLDKLRRRPESHGTCNVRLRDGRGAWRIFEILLTNLLDDGTGWLLQLRDITTEREAAERLQRQEAQFADAQRLASLGIWEWNVESGRMMWSEELFQIIGIRAGENEITFDTLRARLHPEDRDRVEKAALRSMRERRTLDVHCRIVRPSGSVRTLHCRARAVADENGRVVRLSGIAQDVTETLQADVELRESEARFRRIADSNIIGIMSWNARGQITEANDAFLKLVGYTRADLREGRVGWDELTPPEFHDADSHALQQLADLGVCQPYEKEYLHKDGTRVPILIGGAYLEPGSGRDLGICFVLDMSEHQNKRSPGYAASEAVLLESERLYRATIGAIPYGVLVHRDGVVLTANESAAQLLGAPSQLEVAGRALLDFIHPDSQSALRPALKRQAPSRENEESIPIRLLHRDGERREFEAISTPILLGGQPAIQTILLDRTAHARAERELQHNAEHFRSLVENATDVISIVDSHGLTIYQSPASEFLTGYAAHERVGAPWLEAVHPEDRPRVVHLWEEIRHAPGQTRTLEYRWRHRDGSWRRVESSGRLLPPGTPYQGIIVVTRETTGRHDAENGLREADAAWQSGEAFPNIYLRLDTEGMVLACHTSGRFVGAERFLLPEQVFGRRVQELLPSPASGAMAVAIAEVARTRRAVRMEYELSLSGVKHCFEARLQPLLDGQIIAIVRSVSGDVNAAAEAPLEVILLSDAVKSALERQTPSTRKCVVQLGECEKCSLEILARRQELDEALSIVLGRALEAAQAKTTLHVGCEAHFAENNGAGENRLQGRVRVRFSGEGHPKVSALDSVQKILISIDATAGVESAGNAFVFWIDLAAAHVV